MRHRGRTSGPSARLLALLLPLVLLLSIVGTAVAQDRYEELLDELPEVELASECMAEQEGDLAAVPGTIVICTPTTDDPDRFWWREASGDEVEAVLEDTDLASDEPVEAEADEPVEVEAPTRIDAGGGGLAARSLLSPWLYIGLAVMLLTGLLAARWSLRSRGP